MTLDENWHLAISIVTSPRHSCVIATVLNQVNVRLMDYVGKREQNLTCTAFNVL